MITHSNGIFNIETENTCYIFSVEDAGWAEHIYYGRKLKGAFSSISAIREKHLKAPHMATLAKREYSEFTLSDTLLEFSTEGRGDYKLPLVALSRGERKERSLPLEYSSYQISKGIVRFKGPKMPQAIASEEEAETLAITYTTEDERIKLVTYYTAFFKADVISRRSVLYNNSSSHVTLLSLLSSSLDIRAEGVNVTSFSGRWGYEKKMRKHRMDEGELVVESRTIQSGETDSTLIIENGKDTYLSALIYSGAFRTTVTQTPQGITHITTGINPDLFSWELKGGEFFESPEAILAYSDNGMEKAGAIMKKFIENHIRRGLWKDRMKSIMLHTWDALSYDPDEAEVLKMAKDAVKLGMEGICVDDGWFGSREDNTSSLGDWYADTKHFPSGIKNLANEIHYMGLRFGLWFEIEGISVRSMLYKEHKDWIVGKDNTERSSANNQFMLDLSRSDVQDWAIDTILRFIESSGVDYILWSSSRFQTDMWSNMGDFSCGEFMHRYLLGLYRILDTITKAKPNLYIEATSCGGMRFDMGMLSYCASITVSESSDAATKMPAIENTAMIYPLSVMTNIITPSPDRYTGRTIDMESMFNYSLFGALSYSINPRELSKTEAFALKEQIAFYKAYRPLLQYGKFTLEEEDEKKTVWSISNGDSSTIIVLYYMKKAGINTTAEKLRISCANENYDYSFMARNHIQNMVDSVLRPQEIECYNISGDALKWAGIALADNTSGNGFEEGMRTLKDNSSRLYIIKKR